MSGEAGSVHKTTSFKQVHVRTSRYALLVSSSFASPAAMRRLPMVPLDSSAAKIPLPGAVIRATISTRARFSSSWSSVND